jgi:hypothetical protein
MRVEPSNLAQLVIAYHEKFGRYVPAPTRCKRFGANASGLARHRCTALGDWMGLGIAKRV